MDKFLEYLCDEYYKQTGNLGLWNTGLYTVDFVKWLVSEKAIKNGGIENLAQELARTVWIHAQKRPLVWTLESMKREIVKCLDKIGVHS